MMPTPLELYYEGNYYGKAGCYEWFTYRGKLYAVDQKYDAVIVL